MASVFVSQSSILQIQDPRERYLTDQISPIPTSFLTSLQKEVQQYHSGVPVADTNANASKKKAAKKRSEKSSVNMNINTQEEIDLGVPRNTAEAMKIEASRMRMINEMKSFESTYDAATK